LLSFARLAGATKLDVGVEDLDHLLDRRGGNERPADQVEDR
jgi:hypothetical protein